ncbi:MAG: hypothetical protein JW955_01280 [Sedimentisphaerales bacterium]|nr:hypothetical protein [Sedimentisphaerales bacterium]
MMLELQENIARAQSATARLRRKVVDRATREYFVVLDPVRSPGAGDFEAAGARAHAVLREELLSAEAIALVGGSALDDDSVAAIALGFEGIARPLRIGGPVVTAETKTVTLSLAAAVGAVGGMLGLALLLRLALQMRDLGLVLGGPLGALVAVLVVHRLARLRWVTRILPWLFIRPKTLRGAVRSEHEKAVRASVEQWVDWAVAMLAVLCFCQSGRSKAQTDRDKVLRRIGKLVYALHRTPGDSLPVVAHELVQEAKNSGFEGLEGQPAFLDAGREEPETMVWRDELQNRYETFGHITDGDQVMVERPAVVLAGEIVQRGLVRKVRDKA